MICPTCRGRGFAPAGPAGDDDLVEMKPCPDCQAEGERAAARRDPRQRALIDGYRDDTCPERLCDHCGALYRGPALYCSRACAVADA